MASPVVEVDARLADRNDVLKIIGIDAFRAAGVQPGLIASPERPLDHPAPRRIFPESRPRRAGSASMSGHSVKLQSALRVVDLRVAGLVPAECGTALRGHGHRRRAGRISIAWAASRASISGSGPASTSRTFRAKLQPLLPAGLAVQRPEAGIAASASLSRSYRVNMNVLALVALFTGGLLVFSTQALAVVRRRSQLALLRVLGVTRRRLLLPARR